MDEKSNASQSCVECRRRKIRCDRRFPCAPCVARGEQSDCVEYQRHKADVPIGYATKASLLELQRKHDALEELVQSFLLQRDKDFPRTGKLSFEPSVSHAAPDAPVAIEDEVAGSEDPTPPGIETGRRSPHPTAKELLHLETPSAVQSQGDPDGNLRVLEDLALSRNLTNRMETAAYSRWTEVGCSSAPPNQPPIYTAQDILPDVPLARALIQIFLSKVEWLTHCLHTPTFSSQCNAIWASAHPTIAAAQHPATVSLYAACLACGLLFCGPEVEIITGVNKEKKREMLEQLWSLCEKGLRRRNWMRVDPISSLQAIVIIEPVLVFLDISDTHFSMLGSAIKCAQNIGLAGLDGERAGRPWRKPWESPVDREVGRRIWWNLMELDWHFSPEHLFTYSINPSQQRTTAPANMADEDLLPGRPIISLPIDEHTNVSYLLMRVKLIEPYRSLVDECNSAGGMTYSVVERTHSKLLAVLSDFPQFYQMETDLALLASDAAHLERLIVERIVVQCAFQARLMRVHRPYLSRGYRNKKYSKSRETCISCAREVVKLATGYPSASQLPFGWWAVTFDVFAAAICLFIDLSHAKEGVEEKRALVVEAVGLVHKIAHTSMAKAGARVLDQLVLEEHNRRSATEGTTTKPSLKRKEKRKATELPQAQVDDSSSKRTRSDVSSLLSSTDIGVVPQVDDGFFSLAPYPDPWLTTGQIDSVGLPAGQFDDEEFLSLWRMSFQNSEGGVLFPDLGFDLPSTSM
ncbi:hypothetical protein T439DRAFT_329158 [Meredithblackwellia eburnea MCA 4105]